MFSSLFAPKGFGNFSGKDTPKKSKKGGRKKKSESAEENANETQPESHNEPEKKSSEEIKEDTKDEKSFGFKFEFGNKQSNDPKKPKKPKKDDQKGPLDQYGFDGEPAHQVTYFLERSMIIKAA